MNAILQGTLRLAVVGLATSIISCRQQSEPPATRPDGSHPGAGLGEGDMSQGNRMERDRWVTTRPVNHPVVHHSSGITDSEVAD
jgi:hypothetical protein